MRYYMNTNRQPSNDGGNYEVHQETCRYYWQFKQGNNFVLLGVFASPADAIRYAKLVYPEKAAYIDGCYYCCKSANRG